MGSGRPPRQVGRGHAARAPERRNRRPRRRRLEVGRLGRGHGRAPMLVRWFPYPGFGGQQGARHRLGYGLLQLHPGANTRPPDRLAPRQREGDELDRLGQILCRHELLEELRRRGALGGHQPVPAGGGELTDLLGAARSYLREGGDLHWTAQLTMVMPPLRVSIASALTFVIGPFMSSMT